MAHPAPIWPRTWCSPISPGCPWTPRGGLGIPAVGLCSLTWYDILRECPLGDAGAGRAAGRMRRVYAQADLFIRPAPAMPMDWLPNARDVGPIARRRPDRSAELRERLGCPPTARWP